MAAMSEWERIKKEQGRAAAAAVPATSDAPAAPPSPRTSRVGSAFRWSDDSASPRSWDSASDLMPSRRC